MKRSQYETLLSEGKLDKDTFYVIDDELSDGTKIDNEYIDESEFDDDQYWMMALRNVEEKLAKAMIALKVIKKSNNYSIKSKYGLLFPAQYADKVIEEIKKMENKR